MGLSIVLINVGPIVSGVHESNPKPENQFLRKPGPWRGNGFSAELLPCRIDFRVCAARP